MTTRFYLTQRLSDHTPLVSVQCVSQLHPDWVRRVAYVCHNHSFLSCCSAPSFSLVARNIAKKTNNYVFAVRKVSQGLATAVI